MLNKLTAHTTNILLVEDDRLLQKINTNLLTSLGYNVKIAANGKEAVNTAINQHFDLIFMDMNLPDTNGISITKSIRCLSHKNKTTPIVALTSVNRDSVMEEGLEAGLNDHRQKPASLNELRDVVEQWCH